ncbi:MAG: glucans biosynthesis glucosyltransferase MdoH [Puniceicoccales bacterium]
MTRNTNLIKVSQNRRFRFFALFTVLWLIGVLWFVDLMLRLPFNNAKWLLVAVFCPLFGFLAFGFVQAFAGIITLLRKRDQLCITELDRKLEGRPLASRTALLFPIYNEDPDAVTAGIETTYEALRDKGLLEHFDIFLLSDSTNENNWIAEESAWLRTVRKLSAHGKIFYRKRRDNLNQKSGNVADFLRRWGKPYDFFVCYDADSLMTADTLHRMVRIMEHTREVGILQSMPRLYNGHSLFARLQQYGNRIQGMIGGAGLNFWQQGEGNYWGHNAVIRTKAFIEFCNLPELPGARPLGGRVMSHDFVEAALMRKAGLQVWLAYDLEGTFEEMPPSLPDFAARDRRWCQGNLQHSWIMLFGRIKAVNRIHMLNGIMSYISGPLWLAFLAVSTLVFYSWMNSELTIFPRQSFLPFTPESTALQGLYIFIYTMVLILVPKFFPLLWLVKEPEQRRRFGGIAKAGISLVVELTMFTLIAPSLMLFHSSFVVALFLGQRVGWNSQRRGGDGIEWSEAISAQGGHTLIGLLWGILAWQISPSLFWWMSPVTLGWVLAPALTVFTSKVSVGQWFAERGLLLTPEETEPAAEVTTLRRKLKAFEGKPDPIPELASDFGLIRVAVDPYVNALHQIFLRERGNQTEETREELDAMLETLIIHGAPALTRESKLRLLYDLPSVQRLHQEIWDRPFHELPAFWRLALDRYNRESLFKVHLTPSPAA